MVSEFKVWLNRKELSVAEFSVKTGIPYHTIEKWYNGGSKPRTTCRLVIQQHFPDCPLIKQ